MGGGVGGAGRGSGRRGVATGEVGYGGQVGSERRIEVFEKIHKKNRGRGGGCREGGQTRGRVVQYYEN